MKPHGLPVHDSRTTWCVVGSKKRLQYSEKFGETVWHKPGPTSWCCLWKILNIRVSLFTCVLQCPARCLDQIMVTRRYIKRQGALCNHCLDATAYTRPVIFSGITSEHKSVFRSWNTQNNWDPVARNSIQTLEHKTDSISKWSRIVHHLILIVSTLVSFVYSETFLLEPIAIDLWRSLRIPSLWFTKLQRNFLWWGKQPGEPTSLLIPPPFCYYFHLFSKMVDGKGYFVNMWACGTWVSIMYRVGPISRHIPPWAHRRASREYLPSLLASQLAFSNR